MYSDIKQGEHETTDQLDQCIKDLIERYQYSTKNEKTVHQTELFHATKHFEVKKWVRSKKKWEEVTYTALLQYAKELEMMVKDFNWHKFNGGVATAATIDEITTIKFKKGNRAKGGPGKTCSRCGQSHPPRECPAWGKYCNQCGNKNHLSMCCRSRDREDYQHRDQHILTQKESQSKRRSRSRHRIYASEDSKDRSGSSIWSAHSIELKFFQDHPEKLHDSHSFQDHQKTN